MSAIVFEGVGKRYLQSQEEPMLLKRLVGLQRRKRPRELWALRDVSFEVAQGETLGIIGRNGSGKTTLLRLLSGVSAPTVGRLGVVGSIAPLIGVGVGFNPELTGRENVRVNGRLLGMSDADVRRHFDSIVDFSEIEDFIDTPVKFYSSGMFLRLAFSIAVHTRPDVLVVDEVMAVGDIAFQLKCDERMREIQREGTTIVIVTHNLEMLGRSCPRAMLLSHGRVVYDGRVDDAIGAYHELMATPEGDEEEWLGALREGGSVPQFGGGARVTADLVNSAGASSRQFPTGDKMTVRFTASFEREMVDPIVGVVVCQAGGQGIYMIHSLPGEYRGTHGPERPLEGEIDLDVRMLSGSYTAMTVVYDRDGAIVMGSSMPEHFYVVSLRRGFGIVDMDAQMTLDGQVVELPEVRRLDSV